MPDRAKPPGQPPAKDWSAHPYLCPTALSEAQVPGREPGEPPGLDRRRARLPAPAGWPPAPEWHPQAGQAGPPVLRAPTSGPRKRRRPVPSRTCPHTRRRRPLAGAADASGLKVKAAPHNPALAATVMPNKSKSSTQTLRYSVSEGVFPQPKGASELYRCPEAFLDERPNWLHNRDTTRAAP